MLHDAEILPWHFLTVILAKSILPTGNVNVEKLAGLSSSRLLDDSSHFSRTDIRSEVTSPTEISLQMLL